MENLKSKVVVLFTAFNMLLTNFFGIFTPLLYVVAGLMIADLFTRAYAAGAREDEKVQSKLVIKGIYRKLGMVMLILLSLLLDYGLIQIANTLGIMVATKVIFTALTLAWIFVRELISNLENLSHAGMDLPPFIVKALNIAKDKVDSMGNAVIGGESKDENI
ncbi:phage holin family protein [Niameybacter massiliensis]|uniref:Phage holin family protein n=1 Tax=Holtiella tumoricola TaxID=3018743 RepID=A0AA42DN20_9FIRM|nr:phage holin family protein [Holtiella tumoricola]MDA3732023.1 phage holin family protein [Holtiella tumoricola]